MKKAYLLFALVSFALLACNKVDTQIVREDETASLYNLVVRTTVDCQTRGVTFGSDGTSITSQFEVTDCIYVYNETKGAYARASSGELIALHPTEITPSGTTCTLSGDLSFYSWDNDDDKWVSVAVEGTDTYAFFYQMNALGGTTPVYDYTFQEGGSDTVLDFAKATGIAMTLSGSSLSLDGVIPFENMQSMFRFRLSYTNGGVAVTPGTFVAMQVGAIKNTMIYMWDPVDSDPYWFGAFSVSDPVISADNDLYLSLSFHYDDVDDAEDDVLIVKLTDEDGNVYRGAQAVPTGGFVSGNYYYGAMTMVWQTQLIKPTVTRQDSGSDIGPGSSGEYHYNRSTDPNPVLTISGNSSGYYFYFGGDSVITLDGDGTAINDRQEPFIYNGGSGLGATVIKLASDYTIDCRNNDSAIWADWGSLTLETTTNSTQTLTVIANDPDYRGLYGYNNYDDKNDSPAVLAASGFSVELTSTTNGPDEDEDGDPDYYTWVYTISPAP